MLDRGRPAERPPDFDAQLGWLRACPDVLAAVDRDESRRRSLLAWR